MAAKKKTVKKKTAKKAVKKKTVKKTAKKKVAKKAPVMSKTTVKRARPRPQVQRVRATRTKISMVVRNLLLFLILTLISYLLYIVSSNAIFNTFFFVLSWILGFISLAFLISLLVLILLRAMKK